MNKKIIFAFAGIFIALAFAQIAYAAETATSTVCCEKTKSGFYCQDVPAAECEQNARQIPTSCSSTSFCKGGTCYDSSEGTCLDNTPQVVCNDNDGTWSLEKPAQCELGCCILGDQAAFVSLVRCKRLSGFLGLQTNYKTDIKDEVSCVLASQGQEKGACVFESDFEKTCKFTTRADCTGISKGNATGKIFFKDKLCSAEELGTNCGPSDKTTCVAGKDEIYFVDTCGNPANIYDASKLKDKEYWANVKDKAESCNAKGANALSSSCGNCNYAQGSICRDSDISGKKASYGDNICADLNCKKTSNGQSYKHGESWCVWDDSGSSGKGKDSVGSRFYKHICVNGEELVEACDDFRQKECIEDKITTTGSSFSQAACRVNRWQDCTAQKEKTDCENSDKRDCLWITGVKLANQQTGTAGGNSSLGTGAPAGAGKVIAGDASKTGERNGACVPKNPPGLKFWEGEEAKGVCGQGNAVCIVTYEKKLIGGEKCVDNCQCLEQGWINDKMKVCNALGDCGTNVNWLGEKGSKLGYKIIEGKVKAEESKSSGGIFG